MLESSRARPLSHDGKTSACAITAGWNPQGPRLSPSSRCSTGSREPRWNPQGMDCPCLAIRRSLPWSRGRCWNPQGQLPLFQRGHFSFVSQQIIGILKGKNCPCPAVREMQVRSPNHGWNPQGQELPLPLPVVNQLEVVVGILKGKNCPCSCTADSPRVFWRSCWNPQGQELGCERLCAVKDQGGGNPLENLGCERCWGFRYHRTPRYLTPLRW